MAVCEPLGFRHNCFSTVEHKSSRFEDGHSNFQFIEQHYGAHSVLRRIFSLARKLDFQSFVIEEIDSTDPFFVEENTALARRSSDYDSSLAHRFLFFRSDSTTTPQQDDFLGYAVCKIDRYQTGDEVHVYESVLNPYRQASENNFMHNSRTYQIDSSFGTFTVEGSLYAQQNGKTFVCAHVALRSALAALLPSGDITYSRLNEIAGIDHEQNKVGDGKGLSPKQMDEIIRSLGLKYEKSIHEPDQDLSRIKKSRNFSRDLYGYIESGLSALLAFQLSDNTSRHVVPVIGHTFNEDTWVADAQRSYFAEDLAYYSSENWLSNFVIHDDNFGPYLCVPRSFLKLENFRLLYGIHHDKASLYSSDMELLALDKLNALIENTSPVPSCDWYSRFVIFARHGWLVLRSVYVDRQQYIDSIPESAKKEMLGNTLPEKFWMVEVSCPELFSASRMKFGEVLLSCTIEDIQQSPTLAIRLPGLIVKSNGDMVFGSDGHYSPIFEDRS